MTQDLVCHLPETALLLFLLWHRHIRFLPSFFSFFVSYPTFASQTTPFRFRSTTLSPSALRLPSSLHEFSIFVACPTRIYKHLETLKPRIRGSQQSSPRSAEPCIAFCRAFLCVSPHQRTKLFAISCVSSSRHLCNTPFQQHFFYGKLPPFQPLGHTSCWLSSPTSDHTLYLPVCPSPLVNCSPLAGTMQS